MDINSLIKAALLGLVEGVTEFLPISSTGHLIVAEKMLSFESEAFTVCIQLGAILAVCWEYRARLHRVAAGFFRRDKSSWRFALNLAVAFLPAAVVGVFAYRIIKEHLFSVTTVAIALIVGGVFILIVESRPRKAKVEATDDMNWRDALMVGFAQTAALIPGISRAGATIIGGMLTGLSRRTATEFSFFLAIPTMFAAAFYDFYQSGVSVDSAYEIIVGGAAAFVSALIVIRALLKFIAAHNFRIFGWYRIIFGGAILALMNF